MNECDVYNCNETASYRIVVTKRKRFFFLLPYQSYVRRYSLCKTHERQIEGFFAELPNLIKQDPLDKGEKSES